MQNSANYSFPLVDSNHLRIGIAQAVFNYDITQAMVDLILLQNNISVSNTHVIKVAGAVEIPLILQAMAKSNEYDVLIAIGCVIRGNTPHFDYVCKIASEGVLRVMLDYSIPIGFGLITTENHAQAVERIPTAKSTLEAVINQHSSISKFLKK